MTKSSWKIYIAMCLGMVFLGLGCKGCSETKANSKNSDVLTVIARDGECTLYRVENQSSWVYWSVCKTNYGDNASVSK